MCSVKRTRWLICSIINSKLKTLNVKISDFILSLLSQVYRVGKLLTAEYLMCTVNYVGHVLASKKRIYLWIFIQRKWENVNTDELPNSTMLYPVCRLKIKETLLLMKKMCFYVANINSHSLQQKQYMEKVSKKKVII